MKSKMAIALTAIVVANVLGGLAYLGQKLALRGLPPATVMLVRTLVALVLLAVLVRGTGRLRLAYTRGEMVRLALMGTLAFALPLMLGIVGVAGSTSSNASVLVLLEPPSVLLFSVFLLRERIETRQVLGVGAGLVGALLIVLEDATLTDLFRGEHFQGNVLLALHGVLWGLHTPLARSLATKHSALEITLVSMAFSLVILVPWSLYEIDEWRAGPELWPALGWSVAMGVLVSFVSTALWVYSLKTLRAGTVAGFVFIQPLVGVLAGFLFLNEILRPLAWAGAALIAAGVLLVVSERARGAAARADQSAS